MTPFLKPFLCLVLALVTGIPAAASQPDYVKVREVRGESGFSIYARNTHPYVPWNITLTLKNRRNVRPDRAMPARAVLKPGEEKLVARIAIAQAGKSSSYRSAFTMAMGDPNATPDLGHPYLLPWPHGKKHQVVQGYFGKYSHRGSRSLDFDLNLGERIHAARAGLVTGVKQDSNIGGPHPRFAPHSNYVEILHDDGSWATYAHLKRSGALVKPGQRVKAGQAIGLAGKTGQARGPHLHFAVHKADWGRDQTLPTRFVAGGKEARLLKEGEFLYARHPGGAAFKESFAAERSITRLEKHQKAVPADGKVSLRSERMDDRDFVYVRNGTRETQEVRFGLARRNGARLAAGPPLRKVPPLTEMWVGTVILDPGGYYQASLSSRKTSP